MSICQSVTTDGRNKRQGIKESFFASKTNRNVVLLIDWIGCPLQEVCQNPAKESVLPRASFCEFLQF